MSRAAPEETAWDGAVLAFTASSARLERLRVLPTDQSAMAASYRAVGDDRAGLQVLFLGWLSERGALCRALGRGLGLDDPSLALEAYLQWGEDCLQHLNGEFALAVWDARKQSLLLARDRIGLRPLCYLRRGNDVAFASSLPPLLALGWTPHTLNEGMVAEFLAASWSSRDETFWTGIRKVVPGHWLVFTPDGVREQCYWHPERVAPLRYSRDEEWIDHYRQLLEDCLLDATACDGPVGFEVSGGLDSSALFGLAGHFSRHGRLPAPGVVGYTLAFPEVSAADELEYARAAAAHAGLPLREIAATFVGAPWLQAEVARSADFPGHANGRMFLGMREAMQRDGVRVAIGGDGGDHWLGGTGLGYADALRGRDWHGLLRDARSDLHRRGLLRTLHRLGRHGVFELLPPRWRSAAWRLRAGDRAGAMRAQLPWLMPEIVDRAMARANAVQGPPRDLVPTRAALWTVLRAPIWDHVLGTAFRDASQHGIELRQPYMDRRIVEFAFASDESLRQREGIDKWLHRHACGDVLPEGIRRREGKAEFSIATRKMIAGAGSCIRSLELSEPGWLRSGGTVDILSCAASRNAVGRQFWAMSAVPGISFLCKRASRVQNELDLTK